MNEQTRPTEYSNICEHHDKDHLLDLIEWILVEVMSAGGDGDAIWYSKCYWINDIFELAKEINETLAFKWNLLLDAEKKRIHWCHGQSGILITNNKEDFDNRPNWQQCAIVL